MADIVADVHAEARSILAESAGETYDDDVLFPFTKVAYRKAARVLRAAGMGLFQKQSDTIMVAASLTKIRRTEAPTYPADLLRPIRLREKPAGQTYFKAMNNSDGFIPDEAARADGFGIWDWRNDEILLPPCSAQVAVQILYEAALPALEKFSSQILIPDAIDALAHLVASKVARSRDEMNHATEFWEKAMEDLAHIAAGEAAAKRARGVTWGSQ